MALTSYGILRNLLGEGVFRVKREKFGPLATALSEKGISIFHISEDGEGILFSVSVFEFENLISVAAEHSISVSECNRKGFSFFLASHIKRYGLLFGLVLFCVITFVSQLFVWDIRIIGNTSVSDKEILKALSDIGIKEGAFIPGIDVHREANLLLISERDLSSAAISIEGTTVKISVLERVTAPIPSDTEGFYNVISKCDGYIIDIDAVEGKPEVKKGDVVQKGDLLINSFMENSNGSFRVTHARGYVFAAVSERINVEVPIEKTVKSFTGRSCVKKKRVLLGREISFSSFSSPYEYSEAVFSEKEINLFGFIRLPLTEYSVTYYEYLPVNVNTDFSEAEETAREILADKIASFDEELLDIDIKVEYDKAKGICLLEADALLKRDIAMEVEMTAESHTNILERFVMAEE